MNRRRFLALGGALASTGILTTVAIGGNDGDETVKDADVATSKHQRNVVDRPETTLEDVEETALESPEELSEDEIERLLSAHENHTSCPICQGFQSGGMGTSEIGGP